MLADYEATCETHWAFIQRVLVNSNRVLLWGGPSTGKTYSACRVGTDEEGFYAVTLTPETPAAELRGSWMPKGTEFVWNDGVIIKAMREGKRLVINEISHASHDVLALLYPVLENEETAALTLPTGETIYPSDGFSVVCTDNAPPKHLPEALLSRFKAKIHVTYPHPDALKLIPEEMREAVIATLELEDDRATTLREWLSLLDLVEKIGAKDAYDAVFGSAAGEHLRRAVKYHVEADEVYEEQGKSKESAAS